MAQVLSADPNYTAATFYSDLYSASGIKANIQIPNETQSKVRRKRQVIIICLPHRGGAFWSLSYISLHAATAFLRGGKTGEVGWAEKLAHKEL